MKQCPHCYAPNNEASHYCESCGSSLHAGETSYPTATPYQQQVHSEPVQYPVPEPIYATTPAPSTYQPPYAPIRSTSGEKIVYKPKRSGISIFFGIMLYLLGGCAVAFGLASCLIPLHNDTLLGIIFIIGLLVSLVVLVLILTLHRRPLLRGWLRVILFIGGSILAATLLVATFAVTASPGQHQTTNGQYIAMGIICVLYGIGMEVVALI